MNFATGACRTGETLRWGLILRAPSSVRCMRRRMGAGNGSSRNNSHDMSAVLWGGRSPRLELHPTPTGRTAGPRGHRLSDRGHGPCPGRRTYRPSSRAGRKRTVGNPTHLPAVERLVELGQPLAYSTGLADVAGHVSSGEVIRTSGARRLFTSINHRWPVGSTPKSRPISPKTPSASTLQSPGWRAARGLLRPALPVRDGEQRCVAAPGSSKAGRRRAGWK